MLESVMTDRVTPDWVRSRKGQSPPLTLLPAYDATFARFLDRAGVDIILAGDTLGQFVQGHDSTLLVTVDDIVYHLRALRRGVEHALVVGDMPFMSFQVSPEEAIRNAGRLVKEGGAEAIKLEGGEHVAEAVAAIVRAGIPVISHIGVQPQSVLLTGQFRSCAARALEDVRKVLHDARCLEEAGAFAIVVEAVPREVAKKVTESISIPTLGIGSGPDCDGQVIVTHDILGLFTEFQPKFVKRYAKLADVIDGALAEFLSEVGEGKFPDDEHCYHLKDSELSKEIEALE